jgi:hypothetical protein
VNLPESAIYKIAYKKLKADGWRVVSEVGIWPGSAIDGVALKDGVLVAIEAKKNLSKKLLHQLCLAQLAADHVLAVIGTIPQKKGMEWCLSQNIGVWVIKGDNVTEFNPWGKNKIVTAHYREKVLHIAQNQSEDDGGGVPVLLGCGPAQYCLERVAEYKKKTPRSPGKTFTRTLKTIIQVTDQCKEQ